MIPTNFFSEHKLTLKSHKKQNSDLQRSVNKYVIRKSTDHSDRRVRNSSFEVRNSKDSQQNEPAAQTARSASSEKKSVKANVAIMKHLLSSVKKKPSSVGIEKQSASKRSNYHVEPFKSSIKNISRNLDTLKKITEASPNAGSDRARKYYSCSPRSKQKQADKQHGISAQYQSELKKLQKFQQNSFKDYLDFISAVDKHYLITLNFDSLRNLTRAEAWKQVDLKNVKLIESLMLCIYQNIQGQADSSKSLIKEYCLIYFNNFEKSRLEVILTHHYFKMFAFKLNSIFLFQRLIMYFIFMLAKLDLIFQPTYSEPILKTLKIIQEINTSLLLVVIEVEKNKESRVGETFQILRSVSEVERKLSLIEYEFKLIPSYGVKSLTEIHKQFKPFFTHNQSQTRTQEYLTKMEMILSWKHLKVPPTPFLPGIAQNRKYTLVIDLDETLIYFNQESSILKYRPFLDTFLNTVRNHYELLIFTASSKDYADTLIKEIENSQKIFDFRLYRQHLTLYHGRMIKDIGRLGRDLSKTLIIDNLQVNFCNYPQNGIEISTWTGNKKDRHLLQLLPKLLEIVQASVPDVRKYLVSEKKTLSQIAEDQDQEDY